MDKKLQNLFKAIFDNTDNNGMIKLQYIADELDELKYFEYSEIHDISSRLYKIVAKRRKLSFLKILNLRGK